MCKLIISAFVAIFAFELSIRADDVKPRRDKDAVEIVEKAYTALGGDEAFSKFKYAKCVWDGEAETEPGGNAVKLKLVGYNRPGAERREITKSDDGKTRTIIRVGDQVRYFVETEEREVPKEQMAQFVSSMTISRFPNLKPLLEDTRLGLRLGEEATVAGKKCHTIIATIGKQDVTLSIDKDTGFCWRMVHTDLSAEVVQTDFAGFEKLGGFYMATKQTTLNGKLKGSGTRISATLLDKPDDKLFEAPKK